MTKKYILLTICLIVVVFLSATYGKWELLSFFHAREFIQPIETDKNNGCLIELPKIIKVMSYSPAQAQVFIKSETSSTYLINFFKSPSGWSMRKNGTCYFQPIDSEIGGSADDLYWYNQDPPRIPESFCAPPGTTCHLATSGSYQKPTTLAKMLKQLGRLIYNTLDVGRKK